MLYSGQLDLAFYSPSHGFRQMMAAWFLMDAAWLPPQQRLSMAECQTTWTLTSCNK